MGLLRRLQMKIPMRRMFVCFWMLGALGFGALSGALYASYYYERRISNTYTSYAFGHAATTFDSLRKLRAGATNELLESLEENLNVRVISLRAMLDEHPAADHAKSCTNLLRRIADYRSKHPNQSPVSGMDSHIDEMLTPFKSGK